MAPASRPYFVLPIYDDGPTLYRSIGTGMRRKRPKFELLHLSVQTKGIVGDCHRRGGRRLRGASGLACRKCHGLVRSDLAFLVTQVALFVLASVFGRHTCSNSSTPPHAERPG